MMNVNKKMIKDIDFAVIIIVMAISVFGIINIYSATHSISGSDGASNTYKYQILWLMISSVMMIIVMLIDYATIGNLADFIYWASIILLIIGKILGQRDKGANNWIHLGPVTLQPSEFAKVATVVLLSKRIQDMDGNINNLKNFIRLAFYALLPMGLILISPDMGLAMVTFFMVLAVFFIAGLDMKVILGVIASIIATVALVWQNDHIVKPYMKQRLISFMNPNVDTQGSGFQVGQSLIAIGSGSIFGKGFLKGNIYIPESYNDFIFAKVGEEWGVIGAVILLLFYVILLIRYVKIAKNAKDLFGSLMVVGLTGGLLFSILENMGAATKIMPLTGITLPFMSYGGSSMLANFISLGLILNVGMRRRKINF